MNLPIHPLALAIRGAGGGKAGGESKPPVEAPDSLRSIAYARILDLVSEGEIYGFADQANPLTCVFFNETVVQNADGSKNFINFQIDSRTGTQVQDPIEGFGGVESESGVGLRLEYGQPWTRTFTNTNVTSMRVRLSVPALSKTDTTNGNTDGTTVNYTIELATDGGAFVHKLTNDFTGKASNKYERSHLLALPPATVGWTVRVTRNTPESASQALVNQTYVEAVTEIIDAKLRMPMSAYIGLIFDAEQFNNIPQRAYHLRGRIIRIPSNYNPETRTYDGVWDGTFQTAYSNNPAWVFYDMATHPRYGLGHLVSADLIDKWALYKIAQYCDVLVADGFGGMEPRFTANIFLQHQQDAMKVLQDLTSVFRGIMYAAGGAITAVGDMPEDPIYTYSPSNVVDGKFIYSGSSRKGRHTVALVSWSDMSDFGRAKIEYVDDPEGISRYGIQPTEVVAIGCTSRGQARRMGKYILTTERYETDMLSFGVGMDGTIPAPGKIILVADPLRAGRRTGGRLRMATLDSIVVDHLPIVEVGNDITVTLPSGGVNKRTISSIVGNTINVSAPFDAVPVAQSVWLVESATLQAQRFRVLGVAENANGIDHDIVAIKHVEGKFDYVENNLLIEEAPITQGISRVLFAPTNVMMTHYDVFEQNVTQKIVTLNWTPVADAQSYNVMYRLNSGSWVNVGDTTAANMDIHSLPSGVFEVMVTALNGPVRSQATLAGPFDIDPNIKPPGFLLDINASIADALATAENAQATADGAIVSFWQDTPPAIGAGAGQAKTGDIWFDTNDGNRIWRVVSGAWASAQDDKIALAILNASNAQATADGKVKLFVAATAPVSGMQLNDMWFDTIKKATFRYNGADWLTPIADVTLDQIGGSGINLVPDQYSTFEAATIPQPGMDGSNCTVSRVTGTVTGALRCTMTGATQGFCYVEPSSAAALFTHAPGRKYIVSAYVRSSIALTAASVPFYLRGSPSTTAVAANGAVDIPANVWTRISAILDPSANGITDVKLAAFPLFYGSTIGATFDYDGLMVEELVGRLNKPSAYVRGTAVGMALSAILSAANAQATADGSIDIYRQATPPTVAKFGDYWQDSDDGKWYANTSGTATPIWTESTDNRIPTAITNAATAQSAANTAQSTANSKIRLFYQEAQPTATTAGDQWYQPSSKLTRYWNGTAWSTMADQATSLISNAVVNGNFEAGLTGWYSQGHWIAQPSGGVANSPRAAVLDASSGYRLYQDKPMPCTPGRTLSLSAMVARNMVAADGDLRMGAFFWDVNGTAFGYNDLSIISQVTSGWCLVRKHVVVPAGALYATFGFMTSGQTAGGAWAIDNCRMVELADSADTVTGPTTNLIPNSMLGGKTGGTAPWNLGYNPAGAWVTCRNFRDGWWAVAHKFAQGGNMELRYYNEPVGSSSVTDYVLDRAIAVIPGKRYECHAYFGTYRCQTVLIIYWCDAAGNYIAEADAGPYNAANNKSSVPTLADYDRWGGFITAPAGAVNAKVVIRKTRTDVGQVDSYVFITRPYFGEAHPNQTEFSNWTPGPVETADEVSNGAGSGVTSLTDLTIDGVTPWNRVGLRVKGSRQTLGGARNSRASLVAGAASVRTATSLTASSTGAISVNAHSLELNGETVAYSAVANAIVGGTQGVTYVVYTIDPYLDGGVRTYYAQTTVLSAQQAGEGCVFVGNVTIPTSGTSGGGGSGGGSPADWCVDADMVLPDGRYARDVKAGDFIWCWDNDSTIPGWVLVEVDSNEIHHNVPSTKIVTVGGAEVWASDSTPMPVPFKDELLTMPQMMGQWAIASYTGQQPRWERVVFCDSIGSRDVCFLRIKNQCYFAGTIAGATIATHNPTYKP